MAALAIYAASQRQICRKREGVLRQRNAKNEWRESPALQTHISAKTNDRFRAVKQASAKSSIKHPDLFLVALT